MTNELVSVIIPTHDRPIMLEKAIKSVVSQTYTNWELIVILDSCKSDSIEVIKKFEDGRISFFSFQNLGGGEARNRGIKLAKGKYISFLDDDDEYLPLKLEMQVDFLKKNSNYCLVSSNFERVSKGKIYRKDRSGSIDLRMELFENILGSFTFVMVEKDLIASITVNRFLKSCQDWDFWVRILAEHKKKGYILKDFLSIYYDHQEERITNDQVGKRQGYKLFVLANKNLFSKSHILYHQTYLQNMRLADRRLILKESIKLFCNRLIIFIRIGRLSLNEFFYIVIFPMRENVFIKWAVNLALKILKKSSKF